LKWKVKDIIKGMGSKGRVFDNIDEIIDHIKVQARSGDNILIMSNGSFGGLLNKLVEGLQR